MTIGVPFMDPIGYGNIEHNMESHPASRLLVPNRKSNYVLDLQKKQKNPIFQISMDILQNTNFFRAFIASASVPAIYIQQFWDTLTYEAKTGAYSF
ncbi:hypothetical protein Tco_0951031 [Tanacetum coccineum]|uniref:Uncharacterized protein n=1 Tax=Tanacetum coccineum TaxID=301880 RepID=A0ABQ5DVR3_9ASTR